MRRTELWSLGIASLALASLFLSACSVNVKKENNGQEKQVDISTPMGGIHVSKDVSPEDVDDRSRPPNDTLSMWTPTPSPKPLTKTLKRPADFES